jgi:hypothetical protein
VPGRIQFDWWIKPVLPARTREIFGRGHYFEERARRLLAAIGFKFAPPEALAFNAAGGALRGHADGIIIHGPDLPGAYLIDPFLWEHKAVNAKNWRAVERDGLEKTFPQYAAQVALYQAYLDITNLGQAGTRQGSGDSLALALKRRVGVGANLLRLGEHDQPRRAGANFRGLFGSH